MIKDLNEINSLKIQPEEIINLKYNTENFEYNLQIHYKKKFNNLVILSNGAVDYKKKNPPVFMRSNWSNEIEGNLIYLDDPTIHDTDLNLGWGQGNSNEFVLNTYSSIIKNLIKLMDIADEKVCYFGSSAGGFMSMILSSMHIDSFAIVNNPQIDIKSYYDIHSVPLLELSYGTIENGYNNYKERINVVEAFKHNKYVPKIYYIQNQYSHYDLKFHMNPFIRLMRENNLAIENMTFIKYFDKEKGHTPLDKEPALNSLNLLLKNDIF